MVAVMVLPVKASALAVDFEGGPGCSTPDSEGYCSSTVYLVVKKSTSDETLTAWGGVLTLRDANASSGIKDLVVSSVDETKYVVQYSGNAITGEGKILVQVKDDSNLSATANTRVVKITYKHLQSLALDGINCGLHFVLTGKEGEEIVTPDVPTNTNTGASLPYMVLGVAAVGALVIYMASSKKSKLHNL
jgi:hypothetical protein